MKFSDRYPCLFDATTTVNFPVDYVYHTSWAARRLLSRRPELHHDISSSLYFAGICSAFIPIHHFDFRQPQLNLPGLRTGTANLLRLPFEDNSVTSLSCMHVVEHIGLGRYGDDLDPDGDLKAIAELKRVVAKNGHLLFVVPIGKPRIEFNAHRIYSFAQIMEHFNGFELAEFALIRNRHPEDGLILAPSEKLIEQESDACGCFDFKKR